MERDVNETLAAIVARFDIPGRLVTSAPLGFGHINASHVLACAVGPRTDCYLLQRINDAIFRAPEPLMANIARVTAHIAAGLRARGTPDVARRVLTLVPSTAGATFVRDASGAYWRVYRFIEGTRVYEAVARPAQAEHAGFAFGEFQQQLVDLPAPPLHETIPDFHHTPLRFAALARAVAADAGGRRATAEREIAFALQRREAAGALVALQTGGQIPTRIVHNDAKITNVLFDAQTDAALCVTDLDTVMPGLSLYDFGDMVRSMTCTAAEDEPDVRRIVVEPELFAGLARGYLAAAGAFLTPVERTHLVTAGQIITLEQGVRFLTDYLQGDAYYRTSGPDHNLVRARAQFALVQSLEGHARELQAIVHDL
jgi:hypothetical protein